MNKPLVTLFLFGYNNEKYVREACDSTLSQTYSPLEIIFSDDASSDGTYEIMQEIARNYRGPHKIALNRNNKNTGICEHTNIANKISKGELIIAAHADDISLPDRVEIIVDQYLSLDKNVSCLHSAVQRITNAGKDIENWEPPLTTPQSNIDTYAREMALIIGATMAWTKEMFNHFGPLQYVQGYEDLMIAFRGQLYKGTRYIDQPLVKYRYDAGNTAREKSKPKTLSRELNRLTIKMNVIGQRSVDCKTAGLENLSRALYLYYWKLKIRKIMTQWHIKPVQYIVYPVVAIFFYVLRLLKK